jgi:hypothetical protein
MLAAKTDGVSAAGRSSAGLMVVGGAAQHGVSINCTLLILVLFTAYFLLMFVCSHFSNIRPASKRITLIAEPSSA